MGFLFKKNRQNAVSNKKITDKELAIVITSPYRYTAVDSDMLLKHAQINFIGFNNILKEQNLKKRIRNKVFYTLALFFNKAYYQREEVSIESKLREMLYKLGHANIGIWSFRIFVRAAKIALDSEYCTKRLNSIEVDDHVRYAFDNMKRILVDEDYEVHGEDFVRFDDTRVLERDLYFMDKRFPIFGLRLNETKFKGINIFGISLINCDHKNYLATRKSNFQKRFYRFKKSIYRYIVFLADPKYLSKKIEEIRERKESLDDHWPDLKLGYKYDDAEMKVKKSIRDVVLEVADLDEETNKYISIIYHEHEIGDPRSMVEVFNQAMIYLKELM